jgi:AraC family transcriptional regulator, positive regulator of tynA and feaB
MNGTTSWISTASVAPGERLEFWRSQVGSLLTHLECKAVPSEKFQGTIKANMTSATSLLVLRASAHSIARATPRLAQKGEEHVFVCVQREGTAVVEQDGRQAILRPGDMTLLDTSQAFSAEFPDELEQLVFQAPRRLVRQHVGALERLTATVVSEEGPLGVITGQFLRSFAQQVDKLRPSVARRLSDQALDMVAMAFMSPLEETESRSSLTRSALAYRGRAFIEANLRSPHLSPADVAEHLGISKRYLNTVFSGDGLSVERFIRDRRLQKCAHDLADMGQSIRPIGDIAFAWGFNNLAHFSQSFRGVFGQAPREYRKQALAETSLV